MHTLVPTSADALRALIKTIQAEARITVLAEMGAGNGITVLPGIDPATRRCKATALEIEITDANGNQIGYWRRLEEPESWRGVSYMRGKWHPARWQGSQTLIDAQGRPWSSPLPTMVQDNFGNLVEVPA